MTSAWAPFYPEMQKHYIDASRHAKRSSRNNMTTATSLTTPQKFSISKLLEEARLGDRRLSSPILARCNRSSLKWLPVESTLPASPLTCTTDIRLYCKNQLFLQISDDGSVSGTRDQLCPYATLEIHTLSKNTVRIYSPKVKKYLAIDSNGRLCSKEASEDTVLHHTHELNDFHTFASQKYYKDSAHDMFVALQRDGQPRKATTTYRLHKASQFLIV
ncbi:fibroblast growth factor 1 isoform X2 [Nematostella vectensis]|uniref:fibroblast growth factor 1 isoform X2 n=1 Tax=Nematostella vectensis TaxID=45351 RepID=UPI00138FFD20|nr:fibroblast growth factor 1 isoform X2 [Nematostella vectensis]